MSDLKSSKRPPADKLLSTIADYVLDNNVGSEAALNTAKYCLIDSLGCAIMALNFPACRKLLGPIVPNANLEHGARIPGTDFQLEPVHAAFNLGAMIRWLDYNDTWLAAEWGHPSDNFGALLAVADYQSRINRSTNKTPITLKEVLVAAIKVYEIQGVLALENSFNRIGLDHVILVRIASTAVVTGLLGGNKQQIIDAVSNAWLDGGALRTYRHAPNTGSRKSWAAGDAASRAVRLALMALKNEMGYPSTLSAKQWGFYDVLFGGKTFSLPQEFGCYVMENILFKVSFPAEFHAQTAVEAALNLHEKVKHRLDDIEKIEIHTQEAGVRIIDKTGPLNNPADRDHCLQYMVAIPLIYGRLAADDYEDDIATNRLIDELRNKMQVFENTQYSADYLDQNKRAIPNSVQVFYGDGSNTEKVEVYYPVGHRRRRDEAIPLLEEKFTNSLLTHYDETQRMLIQKQIKAMEKPETVFIDDFMNSFALNNETS